MTQTDADAKPDEGRPRGTGPVALVQRLFGTVLNFVKQVVGELRKVRWPTRRELVTYTIVVLVFVLIVLGYVSLLDFAFGEAVTWLYSTFGGGGAPEAPAVP